MSDIFTGLLVLVAIIGFCLWFFPVWHVWKARKSGEADLAEATYEQKIQVAEADGRLAAAQKNKAAAIIEAEAVAAQINTIGEGLQRHDLYLRWQWIKMMEESGAYRETIYVPTEANLPILEAGRMSEANRIQPTSQS
jgi:hypothetical protein